MTDSIEERCGIELGLLTWRSLLPLTKFLHF